VFSILADTQAITVHINYTYDASGFFAVNDGDPNAPGSLAHATVEKAAQDLSDALTNVANASLNAVTSGHIDSGNDLGTIDWTLSFRNPSTVPLADPSDLSNQISLTDFSPYTADVFTVYAGASTLVGSTELGEGAPVSVQSSFSYGGGTEEQTIEGVNDAIALSNGFMLRGSGPTVHQVPGQINDLGAPINYVLDVGAVAGFLSVTSGANWHLDYHTMPAGGEFDLYTVALHEMMHALGFGSSKTWRDLRAANNADWSGPHVIALRGNGTGVLDGDTDSAHISTNEVSTTITTTAGVPAGTAQKPVMNPNLPDRDPDDTTKGVRRTLTQLDLAFLRDLGYGNPPSAAPTPSTTPIPLSTPVPPPAATPVPNPPEAPTLVGKPKIKTTKPKITIGGTLLSPTAYVQFKIGTNGKFTKAKGTTAWKITVKLKPGVNIVYIESYDPVSHLSSAMKKITITRKK